MFCYLSHLLVSTIIPLSSFIKNGEVCNDICQITKLATIRNKETGSLNASTSIYYYKIHVNQIKCDQISNPICNIENKKEQKQLVIALDVRQHK